MRSMIYAAVLSLAGMVLAGGANAAPVVGANPGSGASGLHKVQEFGIYIGPRYGYRGYRDYDYGYGYGYGYNPGYYYGPRRYYNSEGYYYRGEPSGRRTFRRLDRRSP
jgi:hypothetical protein